MGEGGLPRCQVLITLLQEHRCYGNLVESTATRHRSVRDAVTSDCRTHSWHQDTETTDDPVGCELRTAYIDNAGAGAVVQLMNREVQFWDLRTTTRSRVLSASADRDLIDARFDRTGRRVLCSRTMTWHS